MAKKKSIEEECEVQVNPIKEQAEVVLQSVENTLVEMEIFTEKLRSANESVSRIVSAKQSLNVIKKELIPYLQ
jgi:oligoribonuclease (3'-5' exoribonuclease)